MVDPFVSVRHPPILYFPHVVKNGLDTINAPDGIGSV